MIKYFTTEVYKFKKAKAHDNMNFGLLLFEGLLKGTIFLFSPDRKGIPLLLFFKKAMDLVESRTVFSKNA